MPDGPWHARFKFGLTMSGRWLLTMPGDPWRTKVKFGFTTPGHDRQFRANIGHWDGARDIWPVSRPNCQFRANIAPPATRRSRGQSPVLAAP